MTDETKLEGETQGTEPAPTTPTDDEDLRVQKQLPDETFGPIEEFESLKAGDVFRFVEKNGTPWEPEGYAEVFVATGNPHPQLPEDVEPGEDPTSVVACERVIEEDDISIRELQSCSWRHAEEKGFHELERTFGDFCALIHSEVTEAYEEHRKGHNEIEVYYSNPEDPEDTSPAPDDVHTKPEGIGVELADVVIRIADFCGIYGIDLAGLLRLKHEYNLTRSFRHGGKRT